LPSFDTQENLMPHYQPPLRDMHFVLHEVLDVTNELAQLSVHAGLDIITIRQVLEEGGKFASDILFPLNQSGDEEGCHYDAATRSVRAPRGFREAYDHYVAAA